MKQFYITKAIVVIALFLCCSGIAMAQPLGATFNNPIDLGTLSPGVPISDTKSNTTANGYINNMGEMSDDIYYKFSISVAAEVSISHCASTFDTYIHLLNSNGTIIDFIDDYGVLCRNTLQASLKKQLTPGTYYVVSEGWYNHSGSITTTISIPGTGSETNSGFSQQMTQVFSSLETHRVPYGLLQDIAVEQTNLSNYSGAVLVDSNFVGDGEFHAIYSTLASARINESTAPVFTSSAIIGQRSFQERQPGKIVLTGLFYRYSKFNDNAVQNNQITVSSNKVYDKYISGVWQNPYEVKTAFAISPTAAVYSGRSQQILLPSSLWFTNDGTTVSSIQIDAGDGLGYRSLTYGQALTVNYPDTGSKVVNYKLNLSNGSSLYSHSQIKIKASLVEALPGIQIIPITSTELFNGQYARGTMTIRYSNPSLGLRKPLIVAEGFDSGKILSPESSFGDHGLQNFRSDIIDNSPQLQALLFDNPQFDIVYVDWEDGTDNIKKNALLLKQVIREVNARKVAGADKNVVLGQSMGGLVARWALKDMEQNNENHQTKLFISHDSPHLGVNVPLSFQYLARHLRDLYLKTGITAATVEFVQFLSGGVRPTYALGMADQPAARQMLINYVNGNNQIDNTIHDQWQNELKAKGYPQGFAGNPLKVIAISNGNQCGSSQTLSAGSSLVYINGKLNTRFLGDIAGQYLAPLIGGLLGQPALLLGVVPGRNDIKFEVELNATANGGGNRVYKNKITYTKKILWLIPLTVNITDKSYNAPAGMLPYDSFGGGWFAIPTINSSANSNAFFKYNISASNAPLFNFVPTPSSLDIGGGNVALTQSDYEARYVASAPPAAPKNSPFQNFFTTMNAIGVNEGHLSFNPANGAWLTTELNNGNGLIMDCTGMCQPLYMSGNERICYSGTYALSPLPTGATVTWSSTSPNVTFPNGNTGNSVVIANQLVEDSFLNATIQTACGSRTLTKPVGFGLTSSMVTGTYWGGANGSIPSESGPSYIQGSPYGAFYKLNVDLNGFATHYTNFTWEIIGGYGYNNFDSGFDEAQFDLYSGGRLELRVTASYYDCGSVTKDIIIESPYSYYSYSAYPNPSSDSFVISQISPEGTNSISQKPKKAFDYKLFDKNGKILKQGKSLEGEAVSIDVRNVPSENYFLHITEGKEVIKKQIIIQH
jgi:hypothetical protein